MPVFGYALPGLRRENQEGVKMIENDVYELAGIDQNNYTVCWPNGDHLCARDFIITRASVTNHNIGIEPLVFDAASSANLIKLHHGMTRKIITN